MAAAINAMASTLIDGSVLEGGGQILRNSISLSALLSKPVSIHKIRDGRKPPGLKNQHRTGIELVAEISSGRVTGVANGCCAVEFNPGRIALPRNFSADPGTAGSTTLLLQIALPLLLFSPSRSATPMPSTLTLRGGTNATQAPQIDYTQHVFLPFLKRHFGVGEVGLEVRRRGYYPRGGGEVVVSVLPVGVGGKLRCLQLLERGDVRVIRGIAHVGRLPAQLARAMEEGARRRLGKAGYGVPTTGTTQGGDPNLKPDVPIEIEVKRERNEDVFGGGSGIVLWAEIEGGGMMGGSAVGRKGADPGAVGEEAAEELLRGLEGGGCVDEWLQDQIIIFMALAEGRSEVRSAGLTLHTKTAIWVAEQLTDARFKVEEQTEGQFIIHCDGIGYSA